MRLWGTGRRRIGLFRERGEPEWEVRERRAREGGPIAEPGRPLEGENPGEDRLRGAGNTVLRMNGLAGGLKPLKVAER